MSKWVSFVFLNKDLMSVLSPNLSLLDLVNLQGMCKIMYERWNDENDKWVRSLELDVKIAARFNFQDQWYNNVKGNAGMLFLRARVYAWARIPFETYTGFNRFFCFGGCGKEYGRLDVVSQKLCKFACCLTCYTQRLHPNRFLNYVDACERHDRWLGAKRRAVSIALRKWSKPLLADPVTLYRDVKVDGVNVVNMYEHATCLMIRISYVVKQVEDVMAKLVSLWVQQRR